MVARSADLGLLNRLSCVDRIGGQVEFDGRLIRHIRELHAAGQNYSQLIMSLTVEGGYALLVAQRIVDAVLVYDGNQQSLETPPKIALPTIDTSARASVLELPDARVGVAFEQLVPRIVVLDDFLTAEECDALCDEAAGGFQPSGLTGAPLGEAEHAEIRSSETAVLRFKQTPIIARIEARIESLTSWPATACEPLQVQKYTPGTQYLPHCDFFSADAPDYAAQMALGGQRLATLIMYLRTPESGGGTYFANLGLRVGPRRGSALFFAYPEPILNSGLMHGGERVLSGEKWIATRWFRERDWPGSYRA